MVLLLFLENLVWSNTYFFAGARQWLRLPTFDVPSCKLPLETLGTGMHLQFVLYIKFKTCARQRWNCGNHNQGTTQWSAEQHR